MANGYDDSGYETVDLGNYYPDAGGGGDGGMFTNQLPADFSTTVYGTPLETDQPYGPFPGQETMAGVTVATPAENQATFLDQPYGPFPGQETMAGVTVATPAENQATFLDRPFGPFPGQETMAGVTVATPADQGMLPDPVAPAKPKAGISISAGGPSGAGGAPKPPVSALPAKPNQFGAGTTGLLLL